MEFDLSEITAPFRMQPGLSKMAPDARHTRLLEPDSSLFHEKLSVLCTHPDQALLQVAQFDTRPALHVLAQQLAVEWPQACTFADDILNLPTLGLQLNLQSLDVQVTAQCVVSDCVHALSHPQRVWAALSLFLQDDLAVLDGTSTQLKMLAVCVPSHWSPEEKIGLPLAAVHAPVADNALLLQASQSLAKLVTSPGPARWQRFVWTLQPSGQYDGHPKRALPRHWPDQAEALGEQLWLRVEHQSFIVASACQQAVFTIRVMLEPLGTLITDQAQAARLHAAVSSMSDSVVAYRSLGGIRPLVLHWLERRMQGQTGLSGNTLD